MALFDVPGWNLSPALLKRQEEDPSEAASKKKRKRQQHEEKVNEGNVADLYEQHVEKRVKVDGSDKKKKEDKPAKLEAGAHEADLKADKKKKNKSKKNKETHDAAPNDDSLPGKQGGKKTKDDDHPPKLTPLQTAMRQKLMGARFRHLNQTLYTAPSHESTKLFDANPEFFQEYHEGFRQQVSSWPENPVDNFAQWLLQRGKVRAPHKAGKRSKSGGGGGGEDDDSVKLSVLPRSNGTCKVADLGCGDAALAAKIHTVGGKLNMQVQSYDLAAPNKYITKADIANLPLADGSVNVAIFCLALMGTNWIDFIEEAYRVLHWKGELWVAEIKSRFGRVNSKRVEHSVGFRQKKGKAGKGEAEKKSKGVEDAENQKRLAEEVDEVPAAAAGEGTDVSAFVQVLRKRGFALQDEPQAVDLSNKMFVTMKFSKALPATKGKNVKEGAKKEGVRKGKAFIEKDDDEGDEAAVLKPCLYKIR